MELDKIYNEDCQEGIKRIPDASIDCILTDPPYLYLKGQKLDIPFDERALFEEFKRVLKPTAFVVIFGRGISFYRWNTMLADLGLAFKEEIIWDKQYTSSPVTPISRKHETIAIFCKRDKGINKVRIPYLKGKNFDVEAISQDIKRLKPMLNNLKELEAVTDFFKNGKYLQ